MVPGFMRNRTPPWLRRLRHLSLDPRFVRSSLLATLCLKALETFTLVTPKWCGCAGKHHRVRLATACLRNTSEGEVPHRWAIASIYRWPSLGKILLTGLCRRIWGSPVADNGSRIYEKQHTSWLRRLRCFSLDARLVRSSHLTTLCLKALETFTKLKIF